MLCDYGRQMIGHRRIELAKSLLLFLCLFQIAEHQATDREVVIERRVVWIEADCLFMKRDRFARPAGS